MPKAKTNKLLFGPPKCSRVVCGVTFLVRPCVSCDFDKFRVDSLLTFCKLRVTSFYVSPFSQEQQRNNCLLLHVRDRHRENDTRRERYYTRACGIRAVFFRAWWPSQKSATGNQLWTSVRFTYFLWSCFCIVPS